jgi:pyrimidine operon attenuation protein / uracil phosphoribosyltransferase
MACAFTRWAVAALAVASSPSRVSRVSKHPLRPVQRGGEGAQMDHHSPTRRIVADRDDIARALRRISHEIIENLKGTQDLILLGIPSRGVPLAHRIAENISAIDGSSIPVGSLDVTLFRDDLRLRPAKALEKTNLPSTGIDGKVVVLVDDVLYSGRTVRAALDALNEFGRPRIVQLAVLVDRGHRELPIRADYVGKNLPTSHIEKVSVEIYGIDGLDQIVISAS